MLILLYTIGILIIVGVFVPSICGLVYYFCSKSEPIETFPKDVGLLAEEISIPVLGRGVIRGWFLSHPTSEHTLVLMHGFSMNKGDVLKRTHLLSQDFNLFYFDFLGVGESQGKTIVGYSETDDIDKVIKYLKQHKSKATRYVSLYGISQGAGAAIRYVSEHPEITSLIAEAVYFSFWDVARRWIWKRMKTPYFPTVYSYLRIKEWKLQCSLEKFAPQNTAQYVEIPTLLIHGEKDAISPVTNAQKVYNLLKGYKDLLVVPLAGHTSCAWKAGSIYYQRIRNFLKENL